MTLQVHRPKQELQIAPTAQQSLNLVRNLLGTTIGAITYLRGLFPEDNFKDTSMGGLALKSLVRDFSVEADELMDWLERGCFDALEKQYLKTMIFGIYLSPDNPDQLVEAYTFGFSYPEKDQWCITIDSNGKQAFRLRTRGEIMKATSDMLRRLLILTQTLRPLPENAYITMRLFYYDDVTPAEYEPPFFRAGDNDEKFYFAHRPEKIKIGQVETPHHALNLHVQTASDGIEPTTEDLQCDDIHEGSIDMESPLETHVEGTILEPEDMSCPLLNVTEKMEQMVIQEEEHEKNSQSMDIDVQILVNGELPDREVGKILANAKIEPQVINVTMDDNGDDTQDLVNRLRDGINVPNSHSNLSRMPSQADSCFSEGESIDLAMEEAKESFLDVSRTGQSEAADLGICQVAAVPDAVSTTEVDEDAKAVAAEEYNGEKDRVSEDASKNLDLSTDEKAGNSNHTDADDEGVLDCPCGVDKEDFDLIFCGRCKKWGHLMCFGFTSLKDKRIPKNHLCYACLNDLSTDGTQYNLEQVAEVALFRRGLYIAWTEGIPTIAQFAVELGVDISLAKQIVLRLQKEGFVTDVKPAGKPKKRGKKGTEDTRSHHYQVLKTPKLCGHFQRWFSKMFLPKERQQTGDVPSSRNPDVEEKDPGSPVIERTKSMTPLLSPPATVRKATPRGAVTPQTPRRVTRSMSRSSSIGIETVDITPFQASGYQIPTPATKSTGKVRQMQQVASGQDVKRKFLEKFGEPSQRQLTGFLSSQELSEEAQPIPVKRPVDTRNGPFGENAASARKKRKVSVVTRGIAVL
ncbi:uncharacterized protein SPPG_03393 [Spizellomyces punctatus DAOM BR117]|uniref:HORMA domain-containing protein n=1 Tax=Spizellomyces punctatus (strain DAOM BR117) TaxID=645134 RepID=A0A0L0HL36_SPIPD|nr:uncharacterized protein SPPG_03393 [Spizellomyces punctatus DAOM BR117]KND01595.1 hypothetical protein SPPG_03393 [Spizellomyces punctatus DAOM BR117]|eukprot:XP_016609634.1 hypothetical protein SPPG_03393 [Spizellomyces punctatus DAOM BR117]